MALLVLGTPSNVDAILHNLQVIIEIAAPLVLLLSIYGGYWLAARAMRPVQTITHTVKQIGETDLHRRLNLKKRDELGELAATFDHMLDRLESAFERQRQFTADASHELRTPLTIVDLETTRALTHDLTPAEYHRTLNIVQQENRHMAHLVNDLLTLARADSGQSQFKQEEVDLSEVIVDTVERLAPLAQQTRITISLSPLPELTILGDRTYLAQLFTNIVENALKYSAGNGTRVEINLAHTHKQEQEWVQVRIRDNGPGIAPEHLSHLFERFYRVDKSRTRSKQLEIEDGVTQPAGNGLGLSIAQWIAQAHGGSIEVQSQPSLGSVFEICLPLIC